MGWFGVLVLAWIASLLWSLWWTASRVYDVMDEIDRGRGE
jgi:hypothetical protein